MDQARFDALERRVTAIEERNARVEGDKAWETSRLRLVAVCCMTYVIASSVFAMIGSRQFFLDALVPSIAFIVSMQSLPALKRWWLKRHS